MPQVVHTEGGELHETDRGISVKNVILEILGGAAGSLKYPPQQTGWPIGRIHPV